MKNKYEIRGDVTVIFINRKGMVIEVLIDTEDFPLVNDFPNTWFLMNTGTYAGGFTDQWVPEKKRTWLLHRHIMNEPQGMIVDHINHNTLDNRRGNLRIVTEGENQQNLSGERKNSKSGVRGVSWNKREQKWHAAIQVNKKRINVGYFSSIEDAKKSVEEARSKHMPFSLDSRKGIEYTGFSEKLKNNKSQFAINTNKSSGIRNVTWAKKEKSWKVHITVNNKKIHLGYYKDIKEAEKVAIEARKNKHLL